MIGHSSKNSPDCILIGHLSVKSPIKRIYYGKQMTNYKSEAPRTGELVPGCGQSVNRMVAVVTCDDRHYHFAPNRSLVREPSMRSYLLSGVTHHIDDGPSLLSSSPSSPSEDSPSRLSEQEKRH
ncbi:hypothetical protein JZ751_021073 [Albula glossodonta]|uniref:Uncharacterized protein n=1 Tax=Albula glossodonta TaxID=121402 RepID=A0A8T2PK40_9TELE|nr:hypothetical protein JZ751_021073 [Albula glossodonta]